MSTITAGLDVGSNTIKTAILRVHEPSRRDSDADVLALQSERIRRRDTRSVIEKSWTGALEAAGLEARVTLAALHDPEREVRFGSNDEYAEAFRELFAEAVRCRLRSAYPRRADGHTLYPFRRLFLVAVRPA